jgi:hypothetical protein
MDDRGNKRVVVDLELDACVDSRVTRVLIYDLSIDGCMIEAKIDQLHRTGGAIELPLPFVGMTRGDARWDARKIWRCPLHQSRPQGSG